MMWIGLTGGIGSGKSQAASYFSQLGVPIISADSINCELIDTPHSQAISLIKQKFGMAYLTDSGCLNRAAMRELIFKNPSAKSSLENVLHPLILQRIMLMQKQMEELEKKYGLVELPILKKDSMFLQIIERVLLIHCEEKLRILRVMDRNSFTEQQVKDIIANQPDDAERLALADDVIDNSGSLKDLQYAVQHQHMIYQAISNR